MPLLGFPATLASQQAATSRAADLVTLARTQIRANRADSALTLLKVAADSATGGTVGDRVQAYVLLGVLEYIAHRDSSATAQAFRHALQLDPGFQAGGLADVDSALIRILTAERNTLPPDTASARVAASAPSGATAGSPSDVAHDCVRRCRGGEIKPQLIERPQFTKASRSNNAGGMGMSHNLSPERFVPSMLRATLTPLPLQAATTSKSRLRLKSCAP